MFYSKPVIARRKTITNKCVTADNKIQVTG